MNVMDYQKKFIREVAPNVYIKYILEKLEQVKMDLTQIRFMVNVKGIKDNEEYKKQLQK